MKYHIHYLIYCLLTICFISTIKAQSFAIPESAAYDAVQNRYFISNYGSGKIIQIDSAGRKSCFSDTLSKALGMIINENVLYVVANPQRVVGFSLDNASIVLNVFIEEAKFLNDVTCDLLGSLYVTDSNDKAIYKIDIATQKYSLLIKTELDGPNGILFDKEHNRLLVCYFTKNSQIDAFDFSSETLTTLISPEFDNLDGLTMDKEGCLYVSSWGEGNFNEGFKEGGSIYKYSSNFSESPTRIKKDLNGPADIYFNPSKNELIIPLFFENEISIINME